MKFSLKTVLTYLFAACLIYLPLLACEGLNSDIAQQTLGSGIPPDSNPGDDTPFGGVQTGAQIKLDFPIDESNPDVNGLVLQGIEGSKTTFRVRFIPGNEVLPDGLQGPPTTLTDLSISATQDFGGLTLEPFLTESDMVGNEATFLITTPEGPHNKTRVVRINATASDSGGANIFTNAYLLVNTSVILTTGPEYISTTTITGPDVNPLTEDTLPLRVITTTNLDQMVTGIGELIDEPPGRFSPDDLPYYVPIFGTTVIGGGQNPRLSTSPIDYEFPAGTVSDLPGSRVYMRNFCLLSEVTPDLQSFLGNIECEGGEVTNSETSGLPGLTFDVEGFVVGVGQTAVLPTDPSRGLTLNTVQVTTATDLNEATIDTIQLQIFESTTQPDLSLGGKVRVIFTDQVDPNEPEIIVPFTSQPMDLVNLRTVSNPLNLRLPVGMLPDLGFEVESRNVRLLLNVTQDFLFTYATVLPGGAASTALGDNTIEGTSFSKSADFPIGPLDPKADINLEPLVVTGETGNNANVQIFFTPGTNGGAPSQVANATLEAFGAEASKVVLSKTSLTANDFVDNMANINVTVADGVAEAETTIVPIKISGTDTDEVAFVGYGALTLKRLGPQPPLPLPADFEFIQFTLRPDVILSTPDTLKFNTIIHSIDYGGPGELVLSGVANLFDPPGIPFQIPVNSTFNATTLEINTEPTTTEVPQGANPDTTGIAGIVVSDLAFTGTYSPDLKVAALTSLPGAKANLPNGIVQDVVSSAILKIAENVPLEPGRPLMDVEFGPNPIIYNVTPGNESTLTLTFIPGEENGQPTTIVDTFCTADHDFGNLTVENFLFPEDFVDNVATVSVTPPGSGFNPEDGDQILVYCDIFDSAGNKASFADFLVVSNSYFQEPTSLPDFQFESFSTDPEINTNTPPPGFFGPFPGDGTRFKIFNQLQTPGLFAPTVTGQTKLTHYTKTLSLDPPDAIWKSYNGPTFILPVDGVLDLQTLTLMTVPIGGDGPCEEGDIGLVPGGPVCFPAGEALEDIIQPSDLVIPMRNFALLSHFTPDLREFSGTSALSCSARLACNGNQLCPYPDPQYMEPCGPGDDNPNPFGVSSYVEGLPGVDVPVPLNSFGMGEQL